MCHNITILQDPLCELPLEVFFSNLEFAHGLGPVTVTQRRASVSINDSSEPECANIAVGYNPISYTVTETEGIVGLTILVRNSGGAPRPFTLLLTTSQGSAGE